MSRTRGYLSPSRKSKRLYENGYYQIEGRSSHLSGCIACNASPSKHGRSSSHSPSKNRSNEPHQSTPRILRRSARRLANHGSVSSMPIMGQSNLRSSLADWPTNSTSMPMVPQQDQLLGCTSQLPPCHSSETLAAGERIPSRKKVLHSVQPEVNLSEQQRLRLNLPSVTNLIETSQRLPQPTFVKSRVESDSQSSWTCSDEEEKREDVSDEASEAASLYEEKHKDHSFSLLLQVFHFVAGHFIKIILSTLQLVTRLVVSDIVGLIRDTRAFAGFKLFLKLSLFALLAGLFAIYVAGNLPLLLSSADRFRNYFRVNSPALRASSVLSGSKPDLFEQSVQKLELSFEEMQLRMADRHASLTKSLEEMKKSYEANNVMISENHKNVMAEVESMINREIALELLKNNEVFQTKVENVQMEMNALQANHSKMVRHLQEEIYDKVGMTRSVYQPLIDQLDEFKQQIFMIQSKMKGIAKEHKDFRSSVEQYPGNVSYLREISNQQFIENFILLLQKGANLNVEQEKISERQHHKYLAYILLEWLLHRGFVSEKSLKKVQDQSARNFTKLHVNFKETLNKNLAMMRKVPYQPGLTLDALAPGSRVNEAAVKTWIKDALDTYSSDRIGLPDYALESTGAAIVTSRCSPSFQHKTGLLSFFGIPFYYNTNGPRFIIQPGVMPGECWAFKGSKGHVVISLSSTIRPESVTIDHISKSLAFDSISSAPKDFAVYGLKDARDEEGKFLGKFRYEETGESIQQFVLDDVGDSFSYIELKVNSNWGQPDYTCLYRFRVHGKRA